MRLYDLVFPFAGRQRTAKLAANIARKSLPTAAAAIGDRMFSLKLHEARGYIRARARFAVLAELNANVAAGEKMSPGAVHELVELALEQVVVRMIAVRMVEAQTTVPLRRAA
jgi:hypothetical protein